MSLVQCQHDGVLNFNALPAEIKQSFDDCWNLLKGLCECQGVNLLDVTSNEEKYGKRFRITFYQKSYLEYDKDPNLLPFKHEFVEECLKDMDLNLPESTEVEIDKGDCGLIGRVYYNENTYNYSVKG